MFGDLCECIEFVVAYSICSALLNSRKLGVACAFLFSSRVRMETLGENVSPVA